MPDETSAVLDALKDIQTRLGAIERRLDAADALAADARALAGEARAVVAVATDTVDGLAAGIGEAEVERRRAALVALLGEASRPEVLDALRTLAQAAPTLARAAPLLDGAAGGIATAVDTLDGLALRAQEAGIDLDTRAQTLLRAAERLTAPEAVRLLETFLAHIDALQSLLDSPVVAPASVRVVAVAAEALVEVRAQPDGQAGLFAAMGALSDPEVQRAVHFAIHFARAFGRRLATPT